MQSKACLVISVLLTIGNVTEEAKLLEIQSLLLIKSRVELLRLVKDSDF